MHSVPRCVGFRVTTVLGRQAPVACCLHCRPYGVCSLQTTVNPTHTVNDKSVFRRANSISQTVDLLLLSPMMSAYSAARSVTVSLLRSTCQPLDQEIPGLISFRKDWLDLLAVHGTLKSLLQQHHSSKASILFFLLILSHPPSSMQGSI